MRRSVFLAACAASLLAVGLAAPAVAGATQADTTTTVVVTPADVTSGGWTYYYDNGASGQFGSGPGTAPAGVGSFQFTIPNNGKVTLSTTSVAGAPLAAVDEVSYATYRAGSSTIAGYVDPSLNMEICAGGISGQITVPQPWTDRGEPPLARRLSAEGLAGLDTLARSLRGR